ncbi:MAG: DUF2058 family protein [Planctomycetota bacterium]
MGDLRDELIKAGLLGKKDQKRLEHEERVKKITVGREAVQAQEEQRRHELQRQQAEKKEADRRLEVDRRRKQDAREEKARVRDLVRSQLVREGLRGPRRFHFVTREGFVPFLSVDPQIARRLEAGELAIVEVPGETDTFGVVPAAAALELRKVDGEAVRFFTRAR